MKSDAERGPIGAWARHARIAAGYTSAELAADAANAAGYGLKALYLRGIEAGTNRPSRDVVEQLATLYGVTPPDLDAPDPRMDDLVRLVEEAVARGVADGLARFYAQQPPTPRTPRRTPSQR